MTLDEIREALRNLSPEALREVLVEFLPEAASEGGQTEKKALDVAADVIAERQELLRRLALR